jgi:predicted phage tail protein
MLRKIRVYGRLAKFLKRRVFEAEVASAAEAVRFLLTNFPQLEGHMADQHYRVTVGTYNLTLDELHDPSGQQEIQITPVIAGAGSQGLGIGQILLGVALIAASIFIPGSTALLGTTFGKISLGIGLLGGALALQGVATLLTPVPTLATPISGTTSDTNKDPRKSYSFSGIQQNSRQGIPVPIVYGETLVGSVVISAGIDTVQVVG